MIIYLTAVTALLLLLSFFIINLLWRSQARQLYFIKSIQEIKGRHEQELKRSQMEIQEQTFLEISNEIHDNISLNLSLCKLQLNTMNFRRPAEMTEKVNASLELISQTITDLNNISKSLDPDNISFNGLANAIKNEIRHLESSGKHAVDFQSKGISIVIGSPAELILFRIIRESLNNIIRHSRADLIEIRLNFTGCQLECCIKDNGIGFLPEKKLQGSGLNNMKKRAQQLGAHFELNSAPGEGTLVRIILTLPKP